jgi:hypothetical protein
MFTKEFWKATAERAIRGGALVASGLWGVTAILDIDGLTATAQTAAVGFVWGAVGSVLLSLGGSFVGEKGSPSFTKSEAINPPPVDADKYVAD